MVTEKNHHDNPTPMLQGGNPWGCFLMILPVTYPGIQSLCLPLRGCPRFTFRYCANTMTRRLIASDIHRPDLGKPHGFAGEFTEETFTFRAFPDSPDLRQEPALCQSILTVSGSVAPGMRIVGVSVNGAARGFAHITQAGRAGEQSVCVWPLIPFEWATVRVDCEGPSRAPTGSLRATTAARSHHPSPTPTYGLTAPQHPRAVAEQRGPKP